MDQIHPKDWQIFSTNNEDTTKTKKKQRIKRISWKKYYIQGKRRRKSRVATKLSHIPNILPYLICITSANETGNQANFDSDSFTIGFDNHASKTISNQSSHFISKFFPLTHQHIKGIRGQIAIKGQGTVRWKIEGDKGMVHTLEINDTLYIPKSQISILCPQHWYQ